MLFDKHINELSKKVVGTLMFINCVSGKLDRPSRIIAVQSLVLSIINYCNRIWGTANLTAINNVQKLQYIAAKVAKGNPTKQDHATPIIQEVGWLKVKEKHKLETCITSCPFLILHKRRELKFWRTGNLLPDSPDNVTF